MEHWTDHGIVMTTANFKWAKQGGNGFRRTTAFREFQRMKDGRIPKINIEAK